MKRLMPFFVALTLLVACLLAVAVNTPQASAATLSSATHTQQASHTNNNNISFCAGGVEVEGQPLGYPYIIFTCLPVLTVNANFTQILAVCNYTFLSAAAVVSQGVQVETVLPGRCGYNAIGASSVSVI